MTERTRASAPPKVRQVGIALLPACHAIGCEQLADWHYRDQFGELNLCAFHGGTEPVEGWEWIGE
jgi:hypothetical protein